MKKQDWVKLLELEVSILKSKSSEDAQDKMIDAFYEQETQRLQLFGSKEDVGHKEEMRGLFDHFQGNFAYENNSHFSKMALFEGL